MIRDHHARFWNQVQDMMEELDEDIKKEGAIADRRLGAPPVSVPSGGPSMTLDEVRKITASPMEHTLLPYIQAEFPLLLRMRCIILCTDSDPGFITSDNPVVWYDPEAHKLPPLYRSPSFSCPQLQITFPLSPTQMLLLVHGRAGFDRYISVDEKVVREANRTTRAYCANEFVVRRNTIDPDWLDLGNMPPDAWELTEGLNSLTN
jgi:hypothetical protein